jgi:cytochrome oxidase assembly protein ShyY1
MDVSLCDLVELEDVLIVRGWIPTDDSTELLQCRRQDDLVEVVGLTRPISTPRPI